MISGFESLAAIKAEVAQSSRAEDKQAVDNYIVKHAGGFIEVNKNIRLALFDHLSKK